MGDRNLDTQQLTLVHHEEDTHYSCPELVNRVAAILQAVGANVVDGTGVNCLDAGLSQTVNDRTATRRGYAGKHPPGD